MTPEAAGRVYPLHDATLVRLELAWDDGIATLIVKTADGPKQIVARNVSHLDCPRAFPWGPSASINSAMVGEGGAAGTTQLTVEMQSGDVLTIVAESISLSPPT